MEKMIEIIETKYGWVESFQLATRWIELAENQGADPFILVDYVASKLFAKAA